jgi:hypothetical protein
MSEDAYRVARREAWKSFLHKLGIVVIALLAYAGLIGLGKAKHKHVEDQKNEWQLDRSTLHRFADTAKQIAPAAPLEAASGQMASTPEPNTSGKGAEGAATTSSMAATTGTQVSSPLPSDAQLLHDIAEGFQPILPAKSVNAKDGKAGEQKKSRPTIDTRPELVAAIEQLADAMIWRETSDEIRTLDKQSRAAAKAAAEASRSQQDNQKNKASTEAREIEHAFDSIASQDALARTRIAGMHALIEATATQIENEKAGTEPPLQSMFDEKHPLYVLYEICWFTLLALAVLASSWLLMILFTVLPFTSAEGYWTKRIGELIEKTVPGMVSAAAALPLAGAALIAATAFAGTSFATTPGGYARNANRTTIEDHSTHVHPPAQVSSPQIEEALRQVAEMLAGEIHGAESHLQNTAKTNQGLVDGRLDIAHDTQVKTLLLSSAAASYSGAAAAVGSVAAAAGYQTVIQTEPVARIDKTTGELNATIGKPTLEGTMAYQAATISKSLADDQDQIKTAHKNIVNEYEEESGGRKASLDQSTRVDTRILFWRMFGRMQFKVTPAAVRQMAAYLDVKLSPDGKSVKPASSPTDGPQASAALKEAAEEPMTPEEELIKLLIAASTAKKDATNSSRFRTQLRDRVTDKTLKFGKAEIAVLALLTKYDRELLHVCALPRD